MRQLTPKDRPVEADDKAHLANVAHERAVARGGAEGARALHVLGKVFGMRMLMLRRRA